MKKYSLAIFDVDGTLLDTTNGIISALDFTIQQLGLDQLDYNHKLQFVGPPIQNSLMKAYGLSVQDAQHGADIFRSLYQQPEFLYQAKVYEGIFELLDKLRNNMVQIAVATYKRNDYAQNIMRHFGFDKYCNCIHGADGNNKLKKVDIIRLCIDELGLTDLTQVIMIGDSSHDAIGAQQLGIDFLGVTYGFEFRTNEDVNAYRSVGYAVSPQDIAQYIVFE